MTTNLIDLDSNTEDVNPQEALARTSPPTTNTVATGGTDATVSVTGTPSTHAGGVTAVGATSPSAPIVLPSRPHHESPQTTESLLETRDQDTLIHPEQNVPSHIAGLKAMFPDFDLETLQSVLESVGGNQERAADLLLGMSDPTYQSQERAGPTQAEMDEEYARRLLWEEQQRQQHTAYDPRWRRRGSPEDGVNQMYGDGRQGGRATGGSGRDTMTEVQEQFTKFAETGKKTFSTLFTKVKAKMQEFEQNRNAQNQAPQSNQPTWGGGAVGSQSHLPNSQSPPPQQPQTQQYYDPNPITLTDERSAAQGYDVTPTPATNPLAAQSQPRSSTDAGRRSGELVGKVDPSKIGLLPKRPVSLGASVPSATTSTAQSQPSRRNDDDELDYVENPFEDGRK